MTTTLLTGDCRDVLATLPAQSVQTIVTSPPYYGLRKYTDDPKEIGQEPTPAAYVAALVAVFAACWRVLRDDGTLWFNLGDSYGRGTRPSWGGDSQRGTNAHAAVTNAQAYGATGAILPEKNLLGMPWRVAFALQDAGWILRSDIIWSKPNPMPESVRDRPTRAHEYLFLFAKRQRYYYDATAIAEEVTKVQPPRQFGRKEYKQAQAENGHKGARAMAIETGQGTDTSMGNHYGRVFGGETTRNRRSVWTIATRPYAGAHFATMPEALIEPCILAGSASQACETCGAAWRRVVEREAMIVREGPGRAGLKTSTNGSASRTAVTGTMISPPKVHDRGFAPACQCAANTGAARSIVLDPFVGSGTVMRVADRFGRDGIGIDLAYQELQEQRTNGVQKELFV